MSISLTDNDINYMNDYINYFYTYLNYNTMLPLRSEDTLFYIDLYIDEDEWEEYIDNEDFKFKTENINLTISIHKKQTSGDEENCSICFDKIKDLEIYDLKCSHSFHCECIEKWVVNKQSCPLCRIEIDTISV